MKIVHALFAVFFLMPSLAIATGDRIVFGDAASERFHGFADQGASFTEVGALGRTLRRIRKPTPSVWRSNPIRFRLKVAERADNYLTVEFWGGDTTHDHLFATLDGKMLGQMHLGEYDLIDYEQCWPRDSDLTTADAEHFGVFTYHTFLIPENVVRGKTEVEVAIYAAGHVWGYGENFGQFQKDIENDSRGLYSCGIHTGPLPPFAREAMELVRDRPAFRLATEIEPDADAVQERSDRHIRKLMDPRHLIGHPEQIPLLAEAWSMPRSVAAQSQDVVIALISAVDAVAWRERREPGAFRRKGHGDWIAYGDVAQGVARLGAKAFGPALDEEVSDGRERLSRRRLWADLFVGSVEHLTAHRRFFANQMQIIDINAHWSNRALKELDPERGLPLDVTLGFMKEAMGIRPAPNGYVAVSRDGLSKEDGYVGSYGELTITASADAYEASIPVGATRGDAELLAQLRKVTQARLYMRYPGVRRDGRRVARLEAQVSWRNEHFPPSPAYLTDKPDLRNAILSRDPCALAAVRDMYQDGVLAESARLLRGNDRLSLRFASDWMRVKAELARFGARLGTLPCYGEDFTWGDPENGLVVHKDGDRLLFVNGYWRARGGVNNLARVHFVTPYAEFTATVRCEEDYVAAKDTWGRPRVSRLGNWFQYGWMDRYFASGYQAVDPNWPPENVQNGAVRPVSSKGGRADVYRVSYGPYRIEIRDTETDRGCYVRKK